MKKKEDPKASKKRLVKDYENLSPELMKALHAAYPEGFSGATISFFDRDGKRVSAIPFETDEIYYLIRWVEKKAKPAKEVDDIDPDIESSAGSGSEEEDDLFKNEEEEGAESGDVSLDDIENAENSFTDDDNY
jgi:DNA-directed RNA polymerase subunit delta